MTTPPDQWTRMSVDGGRFTLTVRVGARHADLVFEGVLLDNLKEHVDVAIANRALGFEPEDPTP